MTSESNRTGAKGVNYVQGVLLDWGWGFETLSQENDDGFDGVVYIRSKKCNQNKPNDKRMQYWEFTGGMIHVQIKSGEGYVTNDSDIELKVNIKDLDKKKELWMKSPVPCILIIVYESNGKKLSYWADLKSDDTYSSSSKSLIKVPTKNGFNSTFESRAPLKRLVRTSKNYGDKKLINISEYDSLSGILPQELKGSMSTPLKKKAIDFYQQWKKVGSNNPVFGEIIINRTGWSHITRKKRPIGRIESSFSLLPIAARIINDVSTWRMLTPMRTYDGRKDGFVCRTDFIGLTARVLLKARESTEVMVVLKRETKYREDDHSQERKTRLWFYTVYEPGRGK